MTKSFSSATVLLEVDGAIARVTLDRPQALNAITTELAQDFLAAMRTIENTPSVRAVLISGQGRAFCAGGDLGSLAGADEQQIRALIDPLHEAITLMTQLPVPVVCSVHGVVAGAGVSLAMACDFVLAAQGTRFNLAYTGIATSPDASASWHLPRLVGLRKSLELLLLNEPFDADQALHLGLVNKVLPTDALDDACNALLERLATAPTVALGQTKQLVRAAVDRTLQEQLDAERESFCHCASSRDFANGISAFLNRSKPLFVGA